MSKPRLSGTYASVGAAIADARIRAGFSQAQLAKRLNRPQSYVSKIETGARDVEVREFVWIVQRIGEDSLQLLAQLCRDDDFEDLERPVRRDPRSAKQVVAAAAIQNEAARSSRRSSR